MVSIKQFSYDAQKRELVAECSDLGHGAFHRVYPDACDEGVTMVNPDNGNEVTFYVAHTECDAEGDLLYYSLVPTPESVRKVPTCKGLRMTIFND